MLWHWLRRAIDAKTSQFVGSAFYLPAPSTFLFPPHSIRDVSAFFIVDDPVPDRTGYLKSRVFSCYPASRALADSRVRRVFLECLSNCGICRIRPTRQLDERPFHFWSTSTEQPIFVHIVAGGAVRSCSWSLVPDRIAPCLVTQRRALSKGPPAAPFAATAISGHEGSS
jgi:hypothetical protein